MAKRSSPPDVHGSTHALLFNWPQRPLSVIRKQAFVIRAAARIALRCVASVSTETVVEDVAKSKKGNTKDICGM
jgi:hypothetical protein